MTAAEAIAAHLARLPTDPEGLRVDVLERLAIRDPPGVWFVQLHDVEVRIFRKDGERHVSKRIYQQGDVDAVVDHLLAAKAGGEQPQARG